jgi:hypothetical protein
VRLLDRVDASYRRLALLTHEVWASMTTAKKVAATAKRRYALSTCIRGKGKRDTTRNVLIGGCYFDSGPSCGLRGAGHDAHRE